MGASVDNGIGQPEAGTLEALLTTAAAPVLFIPTHKGHGLSSRDVSTLATRTGNSKNTTYFPLGSESFRDFDWLAMLQSTTYS